jgi:hypothetical protein
MEAYQRSIGAGNDILVLDTESEFFRYLNRAKE